MMKKLFALLACIISFQSFSAELLCNISLNLDIISQSEVVTSVNQKTLIDSIGGVVAYVTEKENNHFIVEAFLADHEMRIYGEGSLRENTDKVLTSAWSRDSIVDIECRLNQ